MSLLVSIRSEFLKTKNTAPLYFTIGAAAFGPVASMLDLLLDGVEESHRATIFNEMLTRKFEMTTMVAMPIFLILVCTLLPQVEYRNNTWKQLLASPQHRGNIFTAKFINVNGLIGVFLVSNLLLMLAGAVILHFAEPSLRVLKQPVNLSDVFLARANAYVSLLAICAIQFWLGLRSRNFITPVGVGMALWLVGTIMVLELKWDFAAYFPYSLQAYGKIPDSGPVDSGVGGTSVAYAALFLLIGFYEFRRREVSK